MGFHWDLGYESWCKKSPWVSSDPTAISFVATFAVAEGHPRVSINLDRCKAKVGLPVCRV